MPFLLPTLSKLTSQAVKIELMNLKQALSTVHDRAQTLMETLALPVCWPVCLRACFDLCHKWYRHPRSWMLGN